MTSDKISHFKKPRQRKNLRTTTTTKGTTTQFDRRRATSVWTQQVALKSFPGHIKQKNDHHQEETKELTNLFTEKYIIQSSISDSSLVHSIYLSQIALLPRHFADHSCESDTTQRATQHLYKETEPDSTRPTTHQTHIRGTKHSCEGLFTVSTFDFNPSLTDERKLAKVKMTSNWKLRWRQIKLRT